ncbi:MAG TPA: class IV adenylate cyclase [Candidatus Nanoarchaeia archaeon]|nr:class IV adenylate cyclase [Candidatus Nanoarchaeia archaeon]
MKEIEVKILDINRDEIEKTLLSLGAQKTFEGIVDAMFFDFENSYFRNNNYTLRLRKMGNNTGDQTFLTFKKPYDQDGVKEAKIREEYEVEVSDFETIKSFLESLGLKVYSNIQKNRTSYTLGDTHFELDQYGGKYAHIPEFLEIESKDVETIYRYAELMGFKKEDCKPWSIKDLEKQYKK